MDSHDWMGGYDTGMTLMTHNQDTQSTTSPTSLQNERDSLLSRRSLLKSAAVGGLFGNTGVGTLSEIVPTTANYEGSSTSDVSTMDEGVCDQPFKKSLRVKGVGSGLNHYHLETSGGIVQGGESDEQRSVDDGVVEGSVHKDDFDSYRFTGRVTMVWARGSVTYSVNDSSDELPM